MLTYSNTEQRQILQRFLTRWRRFDNNLPTMLSVHMAWSILLHRINQRTADTTDFTFNYYNKTFGDLVMRLYQR